MAGDGGGWRGMAGDGGGWRGMAGDGGGWRGMAGDGGGWRGMAGDGKYETFPTRDGSVPSPWRWVVGRGWKKTGRGDTTSSTEVLFQDGNTARVRTLGLRLSDSLCISLQRCWLKAVASRIGPEGFWT